MLKCIEICAGAGGQALGLEMAGFEHIALVEIEKDYCDVLHNNRPFWPVICEDLRYFKGIDYSDIDLLAGGVPCPPFSKAGKQLGKDDERDLFPEAIRLIKEIKPKAIMLENVRGFLDSTFDEYRKNILKEITNLGYNVQIKLLQSSDYGVPQLRPRVLIVGIRNDIKKVFMYPTPNDKKVFLKESILDLLYANGWKNDYVSEKFSNNIAPTLVGGSKKHGGPDLGPSRAKIAWAELGIDGSGIANSAPEKEFKGKPKLTTRMLARIQGFPDKWNFGDKKTKACRMIGNAFPPPVAKAVGLKIKECLEDGFFDCTSTKKVS